jgi:hypothetical protein
MEAMVQLEHKIPVAERQRSIADGHCREKMMSESKKTYGQTLSEGRF